MRIGRTTTAAAVVVVVMAAAACGGDDSSSSGGSDKTTVVASFYPLAFAAQRIGADRVDVTNLTPVGAEPHDLELNPDQVDEVLDADVAIVLGRGFQPAVERSASQRDGRTVEVLPEVIDAGSKQVAAEGKSGGLDPHVWLDPTLMSDTAAAIADVLINADPKGAPEYRRNLDALQQDLAALDRRFQERLTGCARRLLVTSHEAFGYLAKKYGLQQEGVAGISPDAEPDAQRLGELADLARDRGVTMVFTEEAVSPRIADTLAREAGGLKTEVLSPLETLSAKERDAGDDYFSVMATNLDKISAALDCP